MKSAWWCVAILLSGVAWAQESRDDPPPDRTEREFPVYQLRARGWITRMDGDVRGDDAGITGTDVDLREDAGVDPDDFGIGGNLLARVNHRLRFYLDYWRANWDGSTTLLTPEVFDGTPYAPGNSVSADLTINRTALFGGYDFHLGDPDGLEFTLTPLLGIHFADARMSLRDRTIGFDNTSRFRGISPLAGGMFRIGMGNRVTLEATAWGMEIGDFFGTEAAFVHWTAEAQVRLVYEVFVFGGYEYEKMEFDGGIGANDALRVDLDTGGPYFGIGVKF